ncbi:MAG TPA: hypothetical protein VM925_14500, partial [Labilithrix sp.]|nr:hypothetical protein [Labilithrix sp.]
MFLERIFLASVIVGSAIVAAACSDESPKPAPTKHRAEAACEHINDVCADTEGFQTQDCLASKASYEKLNASDKAKANA